MVNGQINGSEKLGYSEVTTRVETRECESHVSETRIKKFRGYKEAQGDTWSRVERSN